MTKRTVRPAPFIFAALLFLSCAAATTPARGVGGVSAEDHGFSVKEYEEFHHVLHPLEHEALPKNDFKRIRRKAGELFALGEAILKLGVPTGVAEKNVREFKEWLGRFDDAIYKFKADAKNGTDEQLRQSYSAVHDSFEMLAALLPGK